MAIGTSARWDFPSGPLYTRHIFGMSARRRGSLGHPADHHRLVHGRRVDLEHLEVVGAVELVEHLEVALVLVQPRRVQIVVTGRVLLDPDDVGAELPVRRVVDAEIAVLHEAAQTGLVDRVLGQARAEELLLLAHRRSSMSVRLGVNHQAGAANSKVVPTELAVNRPGSRWATAQIASMPVQCCGTTCSTPSSAKASTTREMRASSRPLRWNPPITA